MIQAKKKHCDGPCDSDQYIWKNHGGKKYCKYCWQKVEKELTNANDRVKPTKQFQIPSRSSKKIKLDGAYSILRQQYLKYHEMCEAKCVPECLLKADQIHHMAGKVGDLYLDDNHFLAVCGNCHRFITDNPKSAIENGFSILRLTPKK